MENKIYEVICESYKRNGIEPSIRDIGKELGIKYHNGIYYYLKKLEKKNLIKHINGKWVLNKCDGYSVNVLNENRYFILDYSKNERFIFKIKNNYFNDLMIKKNDYLIIESHKLNNGDLGLFIINDEYRIMRYEYKEGFYLLSDNSVEVVSKINCIGKVVGLIRI